MTQLCALLFATFIASSALSQSTNEQIVNFVINSDLLIKHLAEQQIIDLSKVDYIVPNQYTDTAWSIYFMDKKIDFNTQWSHSDVGFDRGYDFEIIEFKKRRKNTKIAIKFYPSYFACSDDGYTYTVQTHGLYLSLNAELVKENNEWVIHAFSINDESFETKKAEYPCITSKYKRYSTK